MVDNRELKFSHKDIEHRHRNVTGGGARAAVFGVSDGLVTNISLVLGVAAAHGATGIVQVAGLAGLFGGAFSMAAGEYVSMKAQSELLEHELEIERTEIEQYPEGERHELELIYLKRGIDSDLAQKLASNVMDDPARALETHAREELGIDPNDLGSPIQAASASFVTFGVGALIPLLPFFFVSRSIAIMIAVAITALAALVVGGVISIFTGRSWWRSAIRQIFICAIAGGATFVIGTVFGATGAG